MCWCVCEREIIEESRYCPGQTRKGGGDCTVNTVAPSPDPSPEVLGQLCTYLWNSPFQYLNAVLSPLNSSPFLYVIPFVSSLYTSTTSAQRILLKKSVDLMEIRWVKFAWMDPDGMAKIRHFLGILFSFRAATKNISQFCHFYLQILYSLSHCSDAVQILSTLLLGFRSSLSLVGWLPRCHPQPPASATAANMILFLFLFLLIIRLGTLLLKTLQWFLFILGIKFKIRS